MATNIYRKTYPDWVEKQHIKGTSIKQIGDNYYLYSVTSKYVKGRRYPVGIQRYIGKITEDGLIEPDKISFIPSKDKLSLLKNVISLNLYNDVDRSLIENLPVLVINGNYYTGYISSKIEKILIKHLDYKDGVIYG